MTKSVKKEEVDDIADVDVSQTSAAGDGGAQSMTDKDVYQSLCERVNAIAQPLANRKQAKKIYKLIRKAATEKDHLKQGLGDVQKALRRNDKGIVILAGNVTPIDIYSHIAGICEEKEWPYCYTPSRAHLGLLAGHKRATIALLIKPHESYEALYEEVASALNAMVVVGVE